MLANIMEVIKISDQRRGGLILVPELDERLGLGELIELYLADSRGENARIPSKKLRVTQLIEDRLSMVRSLGLPGGRGSWAHRTHLSPLCVSVAKILRIAYKISKALIKGRNWRVTEAP